MKNVQKFWLAWWDAGEKGFCTPTPSHRQALRYHVLDADANVVKKLSKGKTAFEGQEIEGKIKGLITAGQLSVTGELKKAVSRSDVAIVTVPAKFDDKNKVDCFRSFRRPKASWSRVACWHVSCLWRSRRVRFH